MERCERGAEIFIICVDVPGKKRLLTTRVRHVHYLDLDQSDAEQSAVLGIVVGDALDEAGQHFLS